MMTDLLLHSWETVMRRTLLIARMIACQPSIGEWLKKRQKRPRFRDWL
jgi:sensor histidine kinase regulating citrate/malate metabolism